MTLLCGPMRCMRLPRYLRCARVLQPMKPDAGAASVLRGGRSVGREVAAKGTVRISGCRNGALIIGRPLGHPVRTPLEIGAGGSWAAAFVADAFVAAALSTKQFFHCGGRV